MTGDRPLGFGMVEERSHFRKIRAIAFGIGGWKGAIAMQGFGMGKAIALLVIWEKRAIVLGKNKGDRHKILK
jgi:hypothetical protein